MTTIRDIARVLEAWAPPGTAQSYDNVGLQVGDPAQEVAAVVVALDLTPAVMEEARAVGATLVLTHHPLLFRPLKSLTPSHWAGGLALRLAQAGIALYSLHTNLDAAPGGVSFALAEHLGLEGVRFLEPMDNLLVKLATFVPLTHLEAVRTALAAAGAGQIGHYDACAFASTGTGYFRATAAANPFVGTPGGGVERVDEARLEVQVARWHLPAVVAALRASHPYEEVAYDVYPVQQPATQAGLGAIGHLPVPEPLPAFLPRVAERLETGSLRYVGDPTTTVRTVAVCGGSGSDLIGQAMAAGADAYVTADVTYHKFFDVLDLDGHPRMACIDAGHYETEALTETLLIAHLQGHFPDLRWHRTRIRTSPIQTFVPNR
jgi:dinuclear metal center YbgI/SA1388 family protein